jgi:hypothetical protein
MSGAFFWGKRKKIYREVAVSSLSFALICSPRPNSILPAHSHLNTVLKDSNIEGGVYFIIKKEAFVDNSSKKDHII